MNADDKNLIAKTPVFQFVLYANGQTGNIAPNLMLPSFEVVTFADNLYTKEGAEPHFNAILPSYQPKISMINLSCSF